MSSMRMSLVIPCYNEARNLPLLVARLRETFVRDDIEAILVDNGSTDDSPAVLDALLRSPSRIRSVRVEKNQGYGFGILAGLAAAFIVFYTNSVSPSAHGNFYELYAIAAAVLGGCSLRGGEGSVLGIVLGVVLLQILQNLVNLLGIPSSLNFAVMGTVILLGVIADRQFMLRRQRLDGLARVEAGSQ